MATEIFPTWNATRLVTEARLSALAGSFYRRNFVISGLTPSYSAGLQVDVSAGGAFISGYYFYTDLPIGIITNPNESTQHVYLRLVRDSNDQVTGYSTARVVDPNLDGSDDPADSVKLFAVDTDTSSVTALSDRRSLKKDRVWSTYTGDDTTNRTISLTFRPGIVIVFGDGGSQANIAGLSKIFATGAGTVGFYVDGSGSGTTTSNYQRPELAALGFKVSSHASNNNLNENGRQYTYLAFPL